MPQYIIESYHGLVWRRSRGRRSRRGLRIEVKFTINRLGGEYYTLLAKTSFIRTMPEYNSLTVGWFGREVAGGEVAGGKVVGGCA